MNRMLQADQLVTMLAEATGRKLSPEGLMAYEIALSDVPLATLNRAAIQLLRSTKFMPSPAEIREAAGVASGIIASKDRPTLAWGDVRRAISRVGAYDSPKFDDPIIHATIRQLGGWVALCDSTAEELVWREKDFLRTYAALSPMNLPDEQTERLTGIAERENGPAIPVNVVEVGCLTAGSHGERRLVEEEKLGRIENNPAADLAKRLTFDDCEEVTEIATVPVRSRDEQLAALRAMTGRTA